MTKKGFLCIAAEGGVLKIQNIYDGVSWKIEDVFPQKYRDALTHFHVFTVDGLEDHVRCTTYTDSNADSVTRIIEIKRNNQNDQSSTCLELHEVKLINGASADLLDDGDASQLHFLDANRAIIPQYVYEFLNNGVRNAVRLEIAYIERKKTSEGFKFVCTNIVPIPLHPISDFFFRIFHVIPQENIVYAAWGGSPFFRAISKINILTGQIYAQTSNSDSKMIFENILNEDSIKCIEHPGNTDELMVYLTKVRIGTGSMYTELYRLDKTSLSVIPTRSDRVGVITRASEVKFLPDGMNFAYIEQTHQLLVFRHVNGATKTLQPVEEVVKSFFFTKNGTHLAYSTPGDEIVVKAIFPYLPFVVKKEKVGFIRLQNKTITKTCPTLLSNGDFFASDHVLYPLQLNVKTTIAPPPEDISATCLSISDPSTQIELKIYMSSHLIPEWIEAILAVVKNNQEPVEDDPIKLFDIVLSSRRDLLQNILYYNKGGPGSRPLVPRDAVREILFNTFQ